MAGIVAAAGLLTTRSVLAVSQQTIISGKAFLHTTATRYRRKPRWLGTAKSKLFRVPERPKQAPEERAELQRLYNNYHTQIKAVRRFLIDEVEALKLVSRAGLILQTPEEEEAEWEQAQKINEEWNRKIAQQRDQRLAIEREEKTKYVLERLMAKEQREKEQMEQVEEQVRQAKEAVKSFITRENIDQAIENALVQPKSYNFALDLEGNIHRGNEGSEQHTSSS
ncbi:probable 28S ribosomal protein S26, mitochondrial [Sabethes cyaneus]|uniref:probable 28S ribosomal protein S26, mitochondrial n=1 Tax=Sabethes cyaneus TaxID=53552 RepID=UPI00237E8674|nr:probable 28S ribosomal protein S26, mitochondrial [Sabethes cyaneus]